MAYLDIPVFVLENTGITLEVSSFTISIFHPVTLGVSLGLIVGEFIGIAGVCWLLLELGLAELPQVTRFTQVTDVSLLVGMDLTMAMFVAQLDFSHNEELLLMAKIEILLASLLAGLTGFT